MADFYKRGNIQGLISEARTSMQEIRDERMPADDVKTMTIIRGGQNPSREDLAWDGEKMVTQGGIEQQHFESKEMQSKYYVTHNLLKLQESQTDIAEQLKQAHPDGRDYAKGVDKIVSSELKRLQDNAPDEQSRFEITQRGEAYRAQVLKSAINDENKLIRNAVANNFEEAKKGLMVQARKSPKTLNATRLEMEDRIATAGQILDWSPEEIGNEIKKQDKALVTESLWGRAMKEGASEVMKDLNDGLYKDYYSLSEASSLRKSIRKYSLVQEEVSKAPPIEQLKQQADTIVATGRDINELKAEGRMTEPELFVATQAIVAEKNREGIPTYKHNKELLQSREPKWLPEGVKTYRLQRLQQLSDQGTLNEQSVALIDKETQEKLSVQANKLLAQSKYITNNSLIGIKAVIDKGGDDPTDAALLKVKGDFDAGKISGEEARRQFKILQNVKRVLSWQ